MNYGELKAEVLDIAKLTAADTVGARVAKFIKRAENMIAARVRALEMQVMPSFGEPERAGVGSALYSLPSGTLDVITVSAGGNPRALERRSVQELTFWFDPTAAFIHSYAIRWGGNNQAPLIQFRATPGLNTAFAVQTWARPAALANDADAPALLTAHEALYLHGALHWLYIDAHDFGLARDHFELFKLEAEEVNAIAKRATRGGSIAANDYASQTGGSAM